MTTCISSLLERYGQTVLLTDRSGKSRSLQALIQPIRKKREPIPYHITPLGAVCRQRWLYIGPAEAPLSPGDLLLTMGLRLSVQESRPFCWRDQPLYQRAILEERREADTWSKA